LKDCPELWKEEYSRRDRIINAGLSASEMMPILCHEMAHSTQNHGALSIAYRKQPEYAPAFKSFDHLIGQFLTRFYIGSFLEVNQRGLAEHIEKSQPYTAMIAPLFQRLESQADIIGGMICANGVCSLRSMRQLLVQL
jgi:hypothetical protein